MQVREMIEKLSKLPPEYEIYAQSNYGTMHSILVGPTEWADVNVTEVWNDD